MQTHRTSMPSWCCHSISTLVRHWSRIVLKFGLSTQHRTISVCSPQCLDNELSVGLYKSQHLSTTSNVGPGMRRKSFLTPVGFWMRGLLVSLNAGRGERVQVMSCGGGGCLDAGRLMHRQNVQVIPRFRSGVSAPAIIPCRSWGLVLQIE